MARYLALIYSDEADWESRTADERTAEIQRHMEFSRRGRESGKVVGGDELAPTRSATTVRVRSDEALVTDGPYAEAREALGGFYILECDSIEEACEVAAGIPTAETGAIEVRPAHVEEEG